MKSTTARFAQATSRVLVCSVFLVGLTAQRSSAGLFTLVNENSSAKFDTADPDNNYNWTVDGVGQLYQQAFWFRVGSSGPEQSVHLLPIDIEGSTDTNFDGDPDSLFVRYLDPNNGFKIETRYALSGGTNGSGASGMSEQISITNTGSVPLAFHFFQYADFDINGTADGDTAVFTNANAVRQFELGSELTETVVTPVPSHREVAFYDTTLNKLTDNLPTTLSDTPAFDVPVGPGDVTWAFQWDFIVEPNGSFLIHKEKNLKAGPTIPEPTAIALLGIAAGLFVIQRKKR